MQVHLLSREITPLVVDRTFFKAHYYKSFPMKDRIAVGCLVCSLLSSATLFSQSQAAVSDQAFAPKQNRVFGQLPTKILCCVNLLEALFQGSPHISMQVGPELLFQGEVIDQVTQNPTVRSIRIRLSEFGGAIFTLSREVVPSGEVTYMGRILALGYSDMLVLTREKGQYYFTAVDQQLVLAE